MKTIELANHFFQSLVSPFSRDIKSKIQSDNLSLINAVSYSFVVSHFIDYLWECEKTRSRQTQRHEIIKCLDERFGLLGNRFKLGTFNFINALNNSVKHVGLDRSKSHNSDIQGHHGLLNIQVLNNKDGRIWFDNGINRFDYGRIILRHVSSLFSVSYEELPEDITMEILHGEYNFYCDSDEFDHDDPTQAIDILVDHLNPICLDCGMQEDDCDCDSFIFTDDITCFNPEDKGYMDYDKIMSAISGAYKLD